MARREQTMKYYTEGVNQAPLSIHPNTKPTLRRRMNKITGIRNSVAGFFFLFLSSEKKA